HDVLPSPALLDFLREQALSKTPQSGGSLGSSCAEITQMKNNQKTSICLRKKFTKQKRENWNRQQKSES
ncbi:hypothetical protein, partial [Flavobacterium psychrophilum]|uniref:hypothetical protein n=1 Tax=Flavobacterium psychrophilum TaxID=96345 RepID=UPI003392F6A2